MYRFMYVFDLKKQIQFQEFRSRKFVDNMMLKHIWKIKFYTAVRG